MIIVQMIELQEGLLMKNDKNMYKTRTDIRDGKYVKVAEPAKKYDIDRNNNNYGCIAANQQTNNMIIPIWEKMNLTIEEAAQYSNISSKSLRRFINECTPDFILKIGTKTLIKRKVFEKFLEKTDAI